MKIITWDQLNQLTKIPKHTKKISMNHELKIIDSKHEINNVESIKLINQNPKTPKLNKVNQN